VIKRHFFLVAAGVLLGLMVVAVVLRIAFADDEKGGGGRRAADPAGARPAGVGSDGRGPVVQRQIRVLGVARGRRRSTSPPRPAN
jgi:membrane fusion protein (multidrug efflux system)